MGASSFQLPASGFPLPAAGSGRQASSLQLLTATLRADAGRGRRALVTAFVCWLFVPAAAAGEIIDRVLATVNGQIITLSDARAVLALELLPPQVAADPTGAALQQLIDRRLMLTEIERYAPADPPAAEITAAIAALERRHKDVLAFEIALNATAMSRDDLRRFVADSLRIQAYVQQRFASAAQVSDDEAAIYYKEHPKEFLEGTNLRPFPEVRDEIVSRVAGERRRRAVETWVEDLRRRGAVVMLYLPPRG